MGFKYIIEHAESIGFIISTNIAVAVFWFFSLRDFYSRVKDRLSVKRKLKETIYYHRYYSRYLSPEDDRFLLSKINDEVVRASTGIGGKYNRKEIIYIYNRMKNTSLFPILLSHKNKIAVNEDGFLCLKFGE